MQGKIPCSVLILTRNSAGTLERCLANLSPFGEVLIHDGNSTDGTQEIARKYGARILKQYETDEPNMRVKDFTEIRLKQRADAVYDWVLYLDADEELSDELVREIGEVLKDAHTKTIVKVPRFPIIDGRVRTKGVFYPEIVPRIHNRTGGCTLRRAVHEKYVYDSSFTEVCAKSPLLFPLSDTVELRAKDLRYITLEVERVRSEGMTLKRYLRWFLIREPLIILSLLLRVLWFGPRYFHQDAVPIAHDLRYVWYHWRLLRAMTGVMVEKLQIRNST